MSGQSPSHAGAAEEIVALSPRGRYLVLAAAFLGWMCAGMQMNVFPMAGRPIIRHFVTQQYSSGAAEQSAELEKQISRQIGMWQSRFLAAFLLGAATGGLLFGMIGDRFGRSKALAWSILWYSVVMGMNYFARGLEQVLVLSFVACLGVGGVWPNGVALASEAWSNASRPLLAGLIGTAANVGIVLMAVVAWLGEVTPDNWRWIMLVAASPVVLGCVALAVVPESPRWLAPIAKASPQRTGPPIFVVFRPPFLKLTIIGILLGTIPLLGGWGTQNWMILWADKAAGAADPRFKAVTSIFRSTGAVIGSLLGGWLATLWGRRTTYFVISLCSVFLSGYIFWFLTPHDGLFRYSIFVLGFVSTVFFGWLPLYLPELFPTSVRSTGSGVTFNFGRILSAVGVLGTGWLVAHFHEDYATVGRITHLIYAVGMVVVLFAPDTTGRRMDD